MKSRWSDSSITQTFQTSGSFKGRGVSHFANQAVKGYLRAKGLVPLDTKAFAVEATKEDVNSWSVPTLVSNVPIDELPHLVIASGGNAGLAAASAASILGVPCTVFVPDEQANIVHMFTRYGPSIEVRVGGKDYSVAAKAARLFVDTLGERGYVPFLESISSLNCCRISIPPFGESES